MKLSIVIPVYQSQISDTEKAALLQCKNILNGYQIQVVAPMSLDVRSYLKILGADVKVKRFEDLYFQSIKGYSRLLVSRNFYKTFLDFDYILIYQLDAWVFSDQLRAWTKRQYDYVGAPWLESPPIPKGTSKLINLSKCLKNKVGNGGLSLRKVQTHYAWAIWTRFLFNFLPKNEDMIWSLFVRMKKPSTQEALHFAFEMNPRTCFRLTKENLPFGCHAWEKYDPEFWNQFINIKETNEP